MKNLLFFDRNWGSPYFSLENLESILKEFEKEKERGKKIKIYELRNIERINTEIGFYIHSDNLDALIAPSFWVPGKKNYGDLTQHEGGSGTDGYRKSVAMMYRYLNHQLRYIINVDEDVINLLFGGGRIDPKVVTSAPVKFIIDEDESIIKKVCEDLQIKNTFVVLDTETSCTDREFILGCTWDLYYGYRTWMRDRVKELIQELDKYGNTVTYNGECFDFNILKYFNPEIIHKIEEENRSIDLYKHIRRAFERRYSKLNKQEKEEAKETGKLNLENIGFATLGMRPDRLFHNQGDLLVNKCMRDVEILKELFFVIKKEGSIVINFITKDSLQSNMAIESLFVGDWEKEHL